MDYIVNTKEKLDKLDNALENLMAKKDYIERKLNHEEQRRKQRTHQVQWWLKKVDLIKMDAEQIKDRYSQSCCLVRCCARYRASKDAVKLLKVMEDLKKEGDAFKALVESQSPSPVKKILGSSQAVGSEIVSNIENVRGYLTDDTVRVIGIWGMGGVGKTTLLDEINNSLFGDGNLGFDHVIRIVISKEFELENLQSQIARRLGVPCDKNDIFSYLENRNFLLLLDDLWKFIDLTHDLGIPSPQNSIVNGTHFKRKVILTTRSEIVCAEMRADKRIKVECLNPDQAWELFVQNADAEIIHSSPAITELAQKVADKCGGLPFALKSIARAALNVKNAEQWQFMLTALKRSQFKSISGLEESLFSLLRVSYDYLPNDTLRECFLSCALWPEDRAILKRDIIRYWIGFGLIDDFDNIHEAYDHGYYLIGVLEAACLLEPCFSNYAMQLHDMTRGLALWIASESGTERDKWIVKTGLGSHEEERRWVHAVRVSIMADEIAFLPVVPIECPMLLSLTLQCSLHAQETTSSILKIPNGFFRQMPALVYLSLFGTNIDQLPVDIKYLVNLQHLDISHTEISALPDELGSLKRLRYLIATYSRIRRLPRRLILSLSLLRVLDLFPYGFVDLEEVKSFGGDFKALGTLVSSPEMLYRLSNQLMWRICLDIFQGLARLNFSTFSGAGNGCLDSLIINSCAELEELVMDGCLPRLEYFQLASLPKLRNVLWRNITPSQYFERLVHIGIAECDCLRSITWVLHLPCLRVLDIEKCNEMEEMFADEGGEIQPVPQALTFLKLEMISISQMPSLVRMSSRLLDFPHLASFEVHECPRLKKLPFKQDIINNRSIAIKCDMKWWNGLEWEDNGISSYLSQRVWPANMEIEEIP